MSHTIKTVNSVGEGNVKVVSQIAKAEIKTMFGVHGFAPAGGGGGESITSLDQLTELGSGLGFGAPTPDDGRTGILRTNGTNGWASPAACGGYTNAYVTELGDEGCYFEIKQTINQLTPTGFNYMFGLAYVDDATASPFTYTWLDWALFCPGGGGWKIYESGVNTDGDTTVAAGFVADRSWRVSVDSDGLVSYLYSDDDFQTSALVSNVRDGTSATTCVVPRASDGSYLVGAFALWTGSPATLVLENVVLNGTLGGI